jgi:tRNA pseudouridine13 synthase
MTAAGFVSTELPYLTAELLGVGGAIKRYDEDFIVEEIPLYPACGEGTHTYFTMEKRGLTTLAAIRLIARTLGRKPGEIGYAGLKDAHGITRQRLSIEHVDPDRVQVLDLGRVRVLSVERHTNKIKLGHLAGNRFIIKIRQPTPAPLFQAERIVDVLVGRGVPNYFGPQRFGIRGDNAVIGRAVLRDDYDEAIVQMLGRPCSTDRPEAREARELFDAGNLEGSAAAWARVLPDQARVCRALIRAEGDAQTAWRAVHHTVRKLYVSAVQSDLFNKVLSRRIERIDRLEAGDIAWQHRNGACFQVEDAEKEQPRCDLFEISPTGPLFGRRMKEAGLAPGELEEQVLAESGLDRDQIRVRDGTKLDGARRPLRAPLLEPAADMGKDTRGTYLRLAFGLPPGAYATSVTREFCKRGSRAGVD